MCILLKIVDGRFRKWRGGCGFGHFHNYFRQMATSVVHLVGKMVLGRLMSGLDCNICSGFCQISKNWVFGYILQDY